MSQPRPRAARANLGGSASRAVLLSLAAAVLAAAVLIFFALRSPPPAPVVAPGVGDVAPSAPATANELASPNSQDREATGPRRDLALANGIAIPAGVRLPGPGKLRGRVLDRADAKPLAGVRVDLLPLPPAGTQAFGRLLRLSGTGSELANRVEPIAVTGTDASGEFSFEGVRQGSYFVEARGTRHVPEGPVRAKVGASGDGGPIDVWVRAGGRVVGRVLLKSGSPAARAKVAITAGPTTVLTAARTGDVCFLETTTGDEGQFALCGVPAGEGYQVTASGGDFALTHLIDVVVRAGEDTEVELHARVGATIEGRILSVAGADEKESAKEPVPLAGAHLGAVPRGLRDLSFVEELLQETHAVSGPDGHYVMQHVPPGEIDVLAIAPGHLAAKGPRVVAAEDSVLSAADFELPRGPLVSGRVVSSAGTPIEGVSVRWMAIDFSNFDFDFSFAPLLAQAVKGFEFPKTDAEGHFTAGAFPGEKPHTIDFTKVGYESEHYSWDPAKEPGEITVVMKGGGAVEGIVMDAEKHAPVTSFTITGMDRIDTEREAPGRINPFSGGQLVEEPRGRFRVESVETGKKSLSFSAPGYLPETVDEIEVVEGQVTRGVIVELTPGGVVKGVVQNSLGEPVAGAQVFATGESQDKDREKRREKRRTEMGGPSDDVPGGPDDLPAGLLDYAAALGMLGDRAVTSGADGTFTLGGIAEGDVTVMAAHRDYVAARVGPVHIASGQETPAVVLELKHGGGLFGKANDRFGRPVHGAIVLAMSPGNMAGQSRNAGGALYQGATDETGAYKIEHMVGGGYFLMLTRGDEALNPMSFLGTLNFDLVTVPSEDMLEYDIVDTSSGACRVYGFVTATGERLSHGNVVALGFESESLLGVDFKLAQIKDDGSYEFAGLAPGEYQFQINDSGGRRRRGEQVNLTVEVPDLPEARIDVALPEGGIEGAVLDAATNEPIEGAEVVLVAEDRARPGGLIGAMMASEGGSSEHERSDDKGAFRFERLQAGEYRLSLRPPRRDAGQKHFAPAEPRKVHVRENRVEEGIEFRLEPALAIEGLVRRTNGEPLEGVEILATPLDRPGILTEHARTDGQGAFRVESLGPGSFDLTANKDGYAQIVIRKYELKSQGSKPLELVLREGVQVSVRVFGANGQPVSGATGRLIAKDGAQGGASADAGRFFERFFSGAGVSDAKGVLELGNFGPGEYTLEVRRGLSQAPTQVVKLEEGAAVELRVRLP